MSKGKKQRMFEKRALYYRIWETSFYSSINAETQEQ